MNFEIKAPTPVQEAPKKKWEKVDIEKMRQIASEIKNLEGQIAAFSDVDLQVKETPNQNEDTQVLAETQKTETDKDSAVNLNNQEAEMSKEIQEVLKEIDDLEKSIGNISVIVGGVRKRIVFWESDDVIDLRAELPTLKAKARHSRLEMMDLRKKEILQELKEIKKLEDEIRKYEDVEVLPEKSEDIELTESDIKIESAKKRKRKELKK